MPSQERRKRPARGAPEKCKNNGAANTGKRTGTQAPRLISDPRFRARVEAFWPLGSRIAAELLARLAAKHDCRPQIEKFLDAAVENAAAIKAYGLDRWPGAAP